jgi:hypothetical protein
MITDEQLVKSNGKVRCGRCSNAFRAKLLSIEIPEDLSKQQGSRTERAQTNAQDKAVSDNNDSQIVPRSDITKSVMSELRENWAKAQSAREINSESDQGRRDQLIAEKLPIDTIDGDQNGLIDFGKTTKHSGIGRWVFGPLLALMAMLLIAVLGYQLWLKQAAPILESTQLATTLEPLSKPFKNQLKKYDVILPERRNLNQLELLSARTEAHPTRSSTILLRASLINRAKISQPFPWLELSLSDEDGRLVSRRALAPNDYLHNNRLENTINANELKRVTIELLAFPKQAHGFELRLLNK